MGAQRVGIAWWLIVGSMLPVAAAEFTGAGALEFTRRAVEFGPRPAGSNAIVKLRAYIREQLANCRCQVREDSFSAATPGGPVPMANIVAKFPGTSGKAVVITGHYDTKPLPGQNFVGANDGGSSTGFLLELARSLATTSHRDDIYLVWFDGEEAFVQWSDSDGTYGSRHLAELWARDNTLKRITALVNVDMIGDRDLDIVREGNSSTALKTLAWKIARERGYAKHFLEFDYAIEDDHLPFLRRGVNALDLIDFNYGPQNRYWHTSADTMDKLDARSFQIVGNVVMELIHRLE